jgi:hypothetical protein
MRIDRRARRSRHAKGAKRADRSPVFCAREPARLGATDTLCRILEKIALKDGPRF